MGLFTKKETEEEMLKRLSSNAGGIINMLKEVFKKPQGVDIRMSLLYAAGLAGYACHQAVKAEKGKFVLIRTNDGKKYYFGDDVNKYLLENRTSIYSFASAVSGMQQQDMLAIISKISSALGSENLKIWDMVPGSVYKEIKPCWDGIYDNMTAKFCKVPNEWPILYGIVLQNIMLEAMKVAPREEIAKMAIECAAIISKMDDDSV